MATSESGPPGLRCRVLFVASEMYPLAKTGGLGDACAALSAALQDLGMDIRVMLPGYAAALDCARDKRTLGQLDNGASLLLGYAPDTGVPVYLLDWPELFRRDGGPYQDSERRDWPDNLHRFATFCQAAACVALRGDGRGWQPDLVHAHDWHAGLLPAFLALHAGPRPRTVFTIHNLAYQGNFPLDAARTLGLPDALLVPDGAEFYGQLSCLKAGIRYADRLTTVSPTYAREILTPENGAGMDGLLRARAGDLVGILNGIDTDLWNPGTDVHLAAPYGAEDLDGKRAAKTAVQQELGLDVAADRPLVVGVNRLTHQKMADVVLAALPSLLDQGAQIVLHGEGERELEASFLAAAAGRSSRLAVRIGYQEPLAHRLHAAADLALTPSRFEPCGLTTMYAMRYGALPVTRSVGGLADTVVDIDDADPATKGGTGFTFADPTPRALTTCLHRAGARFHDPAAWRRLQRNAMLRDFGWGLSARRYLALYGDLMPADARAGAEPPRQDRAGSGAPLAAAAPPGAGADQWPEAAD
ncbi:MAG: glycogen synthase GlgA [Acetobacteraceae bacterium]